MKILALESSAVCVSAAIMLDGALVGEFFAESALTHSRTLLPAAECVLKNTETSVESIDAFAVSCGPGSFTGVRIGVAAVKGMAFAAGKPCFAVSTLEAMAWNLADLRCTALCAMDARRSQVYAACFSCGNGKIERLTPDSALPVSETQTLLANAHGPVFIVGDGAQLCFEYLRERLDGISLAPAGLRSQRASGVARAAFAMPPESAVGADELAVSYLRLSQAERELKERKIRQ